VTITPPTGTAAFFFTDVAGSTRLWESDPDGMAASLELHDQILHRCIETNGGYVFSTAGDAFAAAFQSAREAFVAASTAQLELCAADWPGPTIAVRMGIHTGSAEERGGDYFGPVLNRAARIMSAGHGGQLLLSAVTTELLADHVPDPGRLVDLGLHNLRDLDRPEQLFEFRHPDLPRITDPLKTADVRHSNLPEQLTSFVGRARELTEIGQHLFDSRLITLTGVGGTGKTRLSQEAARAAADSFDDGVWLAELAPVTEPALVLSEIADLWGLRAGEGADLGSVVHTYLADKHLLLIVDNCEHVLDTAAHVVAAMLQAAPGLRIIATSRESLGVPGEVVYHVPSLLVAADAAHAAESEAVSLFLDRARTARPGFDPDDSDIEAIVRICRRIDGIPLGVELAAARLHSMDPAQLADRLEDSFRILGSKSALPRHRTLNTTIEWSHDLLKPESRAVFRRLSTFAGGFDLLAAEAVCPDDEIQDWEIIDHLDDLVDKSLVIADHEAGGVTRFRLLEPIRQFGAEQLADSGEEGNIRSAHADYFLDMCRRAEPGLRGPNQSEWFDRIDTEYDNVRAALAWLLEAGRLESYLDVCWGLTWYWQRHGFHLEGIDFLLSGLESTHEVDPLRRIKGWYEASLLGLDITMPVSVEYGRRAVELAEGLGDPHALGRAKLILGSAFKNTTRQEEEGEEWFMAGDALLRENPDPSWYSDDPVWDHANLALIRGAFYPYEHPDRQALFQQSIDGCTAVGDAAGAARAQIVSHFLTGLVDDDWIFDNLTRAVETSRRTGFRQELGHALWWWAGHYSKRGGGEEARDSMLEAEVILREVGDTPCEAGAALTAAGVALGLGLIDEGRADLVRAARKILGLEQRNHIHRVIDWATGYALDAGTYDLAGRLLGRAETHGWGGPRLEELKSYREALESELRDELARLAEEGAAWTDDDAVEAFLRSAEGSS
jgi:predicted ATPase/class 3 adenylate cyclase